MPFSIVLISILGKNIVPVFVDDNDGNTDDPDQYHWIAFILNYGKPGKWSKCQEIRQQYKAFKVRCIKRWISKGQIIQKESNRTNQINDSKISCFPLLIPGKKEYIDPYTRYISGNDRFGKRDAYGSFICPRSSPPKN